MPNTAVPTHLYARISTAPQAQNVFDGEYRHCKYFEPVEERRILQFDCFDRLENDREDAGADQRNDGDIDDPTEPVTRLTGFESSIYRLP